MVSGVPRIVRSLPTSASGDRLIVTVVQGADRLAHRLLWAPTNRSATCLCESSEDGSAVAWPSSPPCQQVDQCELGDGREGLVAVGMAGTSHWSVAIEASEHRLWWDIACRLHRPPDYLGSTYFLKDLVVWERLDGRLRRSQPVSEGRSVQLIWDETTTELVWEDDSQVLELRPKEWPEVFPATVRWKYGFELAKHLDEVGSEPTELGAGPA